MGRLFVRGVPPRSPARPTFEALFEEHFTEVLAAVQRFGVPSRFAEDVAQDVFVAVFRALDRYDPSRPLYPWLQAIAYRTARDHLNHGRRRERLAPTAQLERLEASLDPEQHLSRKQAQELFREMVQHLPAEHRTIFLMAELDQLTHLQISIALGIPKSQVQSRLRRAREDFDKALQRKRMAKEHRRSLLAIPLTLCRSAELIRVNHLDIELASDVQARVCWRVLERVSPRSRRIERSPRGIGQVYALSFLACLLLDNRTRPDSQAAAPLPIASAAVLTVVGPAPAEVPSAPTLAVAPSAVMTQSLTSDAHLGNDFHSGMRILKLARAALAMSQPVEAYRLLKRHMREHPYSQVILRKMLLARTMEQLETISAADDTRVQQVRR